MRDTRTLILGGLGHTGMRDIHHQAHRCAYIDIDSLQATQVCHGIHNITGLHMLLGVTEIFAGLGIPRPTFLPAQLGPSLRHLQLSMPPPGFVAVQEAVGMPLKVNGLVKGDGMRLLPRWVLAAGQARLALWLHCCHPG